MRNHVNPYAFPADIEQENAVTQNSFDDGLPLKIGRA